MLLKNSKVYRRSVSSAATSVIDADWVVTDRGDGHNGVEFRFDMGTRDKNERLALLVHNEDFALLATMMAEADREKAIQAFSKAMIKTNPGT